MKTIILALALLAAPAPVAAATRTYSVTDFDRIRVDGPYAVTLVTGRSPGGDATGSPAAIDAVSVEVQGRTLVVRRSSQSWGGYPGRPAGPVAIRLSTHGLRAAALNGAGALAIDRIRSGSVDLSVSGSGSLVVGALEADRLNVALMGAGTIEVSGKAAIAQVGVRGTARFVGGKLIARDARLTAEGPGDIEITATATATVRSDGTGSIVVLGRPACTVKATGSGSVVCGR